MAPAAIIPLFNLPANHPDWLYWQHYYLNNPEDYPITGNWGQGKGVMSREVEGTRELDGTLFFSSSPSALSQKTASPLSSAFTGFFQHRAEQDYAITLTEPAVRAGQIWMLVTLQPQVNEQFQVCRDQQQISVWGCLNESAGWLLVEKMEVM